MTGAAQVPVEHQPAARAPTSVEVKGIAWNTTPPRARIWPV
jgi:hypothetical protein